MSSISRRTRSRESGTGGGKGGVSSPAAPPPPGGVIVLDSDGEEESLLFGCGRGGLLGEIVEDSLEREERQSGSFSVEKRGADSASSSDRRTVILSSGLQRLVREAPAGSESVSLKGAYSCVAKRTRLQRGRHNRVSYAPYFENIVDDSEDNDDGDDDGGSEEVDMKMDDAETTLGGRREASVEKDENFETSLMKVKKYGIDIVLPASRSKEKADCEGSISSDSIGISKRTRSHDNSSPSKKKKMKLGTFANPLTIDEDKPELNSNSGLSSSSEEDEAEAEAEEVDKLDGHGGGEEKAANDEMQDGNSEKRKRVQVPRAETLYKLLMDTIINDRKELPEELVPPPENPPPRDEGLNILEDWPPLRFSFDDDEPEPPEKSKHELLLDELWAEFDFAEAVVRDERNEDEGQPEDHIFVDNASTSCFKGEHQLILDEQIGYICKLCSAVIQEIRDILPSWSKRVSKQSVKKNSSYEESHSISDNVGAAVDDKDSEVPCDHLERTVWDLIPGIKETLYQHQQEAFEFMWTNLVGRIQLDQLELCAASGTVGGCVISHAPGTGKTRSAIIFIQSYMKAFPGRKPVIIAPRGMLLTWEKEFKKWEVKFPFHNLNCDDYSGKEDSIVHELVQKEPRKKKWIRLVKLYSWAKGNGILGLSYNLLMRLTYEHRSDNFGGAEICKILLEKPGLLVLDEGHTPRNQSSLIWKALQKVKTGHRIILSGTPFQNNLKELYNTLSVVRPELAENEGKGKGKGIWQANCTDSEKIEELRSLIKPFVHVYNGKILENLPGLKDCTIVLEPLPRQKCFLENLIKSKNNFDNDNKMCLASVHPSLLTEEKFRGLWLDPNEGAKTRFIMDLVRLSEVLKEKVVIFCQFLDPLIMIKEHLIRKFNWTEGKILTMDGKIPSKHRQSSIDIFNNQSSEATVLLASTKACCEGITLTGASRVILLDIMWNPSVERQAISRAYRIGQKKVVYTYRLLTSGTGEEDKYEKQAKKNHISKLVFSPEINSENIRNKSSHDEKKCLLNLVSEDKILAEMTENAKLKDMFAKIYYPPVESNIMNAFF